jgi:hypothetical protein
MSPQSGRKKRRQPWPWSPVWGQPIGCINTRGYPLFAQYGRLNRVHAAWLICIPLLVYSAGAP